MERIQREASSLMFCLSLINHLLKITDQSKCVQETSLRVCKPGKLQSESLPPLCSSLCGTLLRLCLCSLAAGTVAQSLCRLPCNSSLLMQKQLSFLPVLRTDATRRRTSPKCFYLGVNLRTGCRSRAEPSRGCSGTLVCGCTPCSNKNRSSGMS